MGNAGRLPDPFESAPRFRSARLDQGRPTKLRLLGRADRQQGQAQLYAVAVRVRCVRQQLP